MDQKRKGQRHTNGPAAHNGDLALLGVTRHNSARDGTDRRSAVGKLRRRADAQMEWEWPGHLSSGRKQGRRRLELLVELGGWASDVFTYSDRNT